MSVEAALRAVDSAPFGEGVSLSGGEVLLRDDICGLVRRLRARGCPHVEIQTNGRMLAYRKLARDLREAGAQAVVVLLAGHEAAVHDFHTRVPGSFEQTVQGIRNTVEEGLDVSVRVILTKSNYRHATSLVRFVAGLGVRRLVLAFPAALADSAFRTLVPRLDKVALYIAPAITLGRTIGALVETDGFPLCHAAIPSPEVRYAKGDPTPVEWAMHGKPCQACTAATRCPGVERAYAKTYGTSELLTIR